MDWHQIIGIGAGVIQIISIIPYVKDIFKGTTRPNIVSYFLWTVIQVIAIFAQFSAGASWSLFILIASTFNTSLIFILCLAGYGYKEYGLTDKICFVLAIITIIVWQITKQPLIVLALAIFADFLASVPTILKAYRDPKSEMVLSWFMTVVSATIAGFSTTKIDFANLIYPVYAFLTNGTITWLAFFGQRREARLKD
ncbi:MAG: hypothetical protein NTW60_01895 [Candidatus Wolfebacteria bacterium]|nr:hypothetical protein [Candidatus Wolfebacteria bacterium]